MFHDCDEECKEFKDKDCYFDKWTIADWKFRRCPKQYITENVDEWLLAYRMFKEGYLPNGGSKGWLHEVNKFVKVMTFIESQVLMYQKQREEEYARERSNNNIKS